MMVSNSTWQPALLLDGDPGFALRIHNALSAVEKELVCILASNEQVMQQAIRFILSRPGKRLRPLVAILGALACETRLSSRLVSAAAAVEALHLASLLHDDVIDQAVFRSNEITTNASLGNMPAVLLGDFFFARSLRTASLQDHRLLDEFFEVSEILVQGEFGQSVQSGGLPTLACYFRWIKAKTARLFSLAAALGPSMDRHRRGYAKALSRYGMILGLCYQVRDDLHDLLLKSEEIGKPCMADCRNGYYTLPVILANARDPSIIKVLRETPTQDEDAWRAKITGVLEATGSIAMTVRICQQLSWQAERHLSILPENHARQALAGLARRVGTTS